MHSIPRSTISTARFVRGRSITRSWTTAPLRVCHRPRPTGRDPSTRHRFSPIRCGRALPSPTSASLSTNAPKSSCTTTSRRTTFSPPAKSWPATSSARAISPVSACRSAPLSDASPDRRQRAMSTPRTIPVELVAEGERMANICNACRYCEGYCATFPALERRLSFTENDLAYLSNLCHNCGACYYSCQYAPPHEFQLNFPKTLAKIRGETYKKYAWPGFFAGLFEHNGVAVSIITALSLA